MKEFPLNEGLVWGESEDVEQSKRVREFKEFKFNKYSKTILQKHKNPQFGKISKSQLNNILDGV